MNAVPEPNATKVSIVGLRSINAGIPRTKNLLPAITTGIERISCTAADIFTSTSRPAIEPIESVTTGIENAIHTSREIRIDFDLSATTAPFLTIV